MLVHWVVGSLTNISHEVQVRGTWNLVVTGYGPGVVASALPSATGHTCLALLLGESCGNFSQFRDGSIICIAGLYKTSNVCMYLDHFVFLFSSLRYSLIKDRRLKTISPTPLTLVPFWGTCRSWMAYQCGRDKAYLTHDLYAKITPAPPIPSKEHQNSKFSLFHF